MTLVPKPPLTADAIRAARLLLGWSVADLEARSKVHRTTIHRIETGKGGLERTLDSLRAALEAGGAEFLVRDPGPREFALGDGIVVRLKDRP